MDGVILGMPGPWADSNYEEADMYTTKIGGIPDWPFPVIGLMQDLLACSSCRSNLYLVAQVYAPISGKLLTIEERAFYVFCCLNPYCDSLFLRALRVQKISRDVEVHLPTSALSISNSNLHDDVWSFDTTQENDHENDDEIDLEDLSRAFSEVAVLTSTDKKQKNDARSRRKPLPIGQAERSNGDKMPVLPCFYIYTQEEKQLKKVHSESSKCTQEFENNSEDESSGETYAEESYEYDRAVYADRTYLKFKKRMDAYPEQCVRYSYGGTPLFASSKTENDKNDKTKDDKNETAEEPGSCSLCGEARHYEMQLMPPLIYFLHEAADDQQRISLEKFDWMTVLVYTCSKSCPRRSVEGKWPYEDWVVAEEAVIIQKETYCAKSAGKEGD